MQLSAVEQKYFDYLDKIAISTLRAIGREVGVSSASTQNKDLIIRNITDICTGKLKPAKPSGRGAPVKEKFRRKPRGKNRFPSRKKILPRNKPCPPRRDTAVFWK